MGHSFGEMEPLALCELSSDGPWKFWSGFFSWAIGKECEAVRVEEEELVLDPAAILSIAGQRIAQFLGMGSDLMCSSFLNSYQAEGPVSSLDQGGEMALGCLAFRGLP